MKLLSIIASLCLCLLLANESMAQSIGDRQQKLDAFSQTTQAQSSVSKATGTANFIRFPKNKGLGLKGNTLLQKTDDFLQSNGDVLGFRPAKDQLQLKESRTDQQGKKHLILQQLYDGVPVYDGRVNFHFDLNSKLSAINGNFIPDLQLNTTPSINITKANAIALELVNNQGLNLSGSPLKVHQSKLYIFHKGLAQGIDGPKYLVYEVEVRNDRDVREFVFVDAHKGQVVEQYTGMAHALSRRLYEGNTSTQIWQEGDALPGSLDQWQQNELAAAKHAYHFFDNAFGWTSYNGADAEMRTVNNDPGISCPNANWNGSTANYCTGTAADDVVAHEWGHAYTEYTSGLIYAYQSGALNESFSDIWGETIDLLNAYEDAGEDHSLRTACSSSDRWRMGEDATSFGGAIRDMWAPTCDGDPGKVSDSQYTCGTGDSGGVHSNSGVPNHAYALLVDGGTYNGQTISGIGFTKAAHIFWQAQSVYLTKTSDFAVLADALESACTDLLGLNLEGLSTTSTPAGPSGEIITVADYNELVKVLLAVELRTDPDACGYTPLLAAAPALCAGASESNAIFYQDFESGFGSWSVSQVPSNAGSWNSRDWVLDNTPPDGRTGTVAYGVDPDFGDCNTDLDNGIIRLESPVIAIPSGTPGTIEMAFDHYISAEESWDGGNIKYRLNSGSWTLLPSSAFTANAYNLTLNTAGAGNNNPLAGQSAFTGADGGSVSGTWGQSQIDLSTIGVTAGSTIQFRWEMGTDGCAGWDGWYIDDVSVYTCSVPSISFSTATSQAAESAANVSNQCMDYLEQTITVQIDLAPSQPATLTFNTTGTATVGDDADYSFTPASVTLEAGSLTQDITVRIYNDGVVDGEETAIFSYTLNANGGNAVVGTANQSHTLTIQDDDFTPANSSVELVSENFESGLGTFSMTTSGSSGFATGNAAAASSTYYVIESTNSSQFAYVNDDVCNCTMSEVRLISPVFDLSSTSNATLTFDHAFANVGETFDLLISTNGGSTWSSSIQSISNTSSSLGSGKYQTPWVTGMTVDLSAYVGNANVKIAFEYNDGGTWAYGAAVDNVLITATQTVVVQTSVNTGTADEQYLGPFQTVYFYDPTTGGIMAEIENLSSHDYGCTTVEVMRSGTGAAAAWSPNAADFISSKAFKVNPTTNNPSGSYQITTYFTEAEIAGWETATGRDRVDLVLLKTTNDITNPQPADPRESASVIPGTLGSDLTYTATFYTGFSSFGVGPATALPVELIAFEGKHTAEGNLLTWETGEEKNNDYFELERSFDGYRFEKIAAVFSSQSTAPENHYQHLDREYHSGFNYYRLKQIDLDGSFTYSPTILVEVAQESGISFFPNPVRSDLHLQLPEQRKENLTLKVYNASGQLVQETQIDANLSDDVYTLDMRDLVEGAYYISLSGQQSITQFKVVKLE